MELPETEKREPEELDIECIKIMAIQRMTEFAGRFPDYKCEHCGEKHGTS